MALLAEHSEHCPDKLKIMRGNRDFYLNQAFAKRTGGQLLDDPHLIQLDGTNILLTHGDLLCTRDVTYQRYRKFITKPLVRTILMSMPIAWKQKLAHKVQTTAADNSKDLLSVIADVSKETVDKTMRHYHTHILIHGHTHREKFHSFTLDEKPARRIVLGDWYQKDNVLIYTEKVKTFKSMRVRDCIHMLSD